MGRVPWIRAYSELQMVKGSGNTPWEDGPGAGTVRPRLSRARPGSVTGPRGSGIAVSKLRWYHEIFVLMKVSFYLQKQEDVS